MTHHTPPTQTRNHNPSSRARAALLFAAMLAFAAAGCATFEETLAQADAGDAAAQYRVAQAYAKGGETAKDPAKAEEYFKKALAGGEKDAKRDLLLLWLETGSVDNAQEIIRDYPAVAEGGLFSWGLDVDLLDRAPVFAKALVMAEAEVRSLDFFHFFYHLLKQLHIVFSGIQAETDICGVSKESIVFIFQNKAALRMAGRNLVDFYSIGEC